MNLNYEMSVLSFMKMPKSEGEEINRKTESGELKPIHIPRFRTSVDILKHQLCTKIIKYKKEKGLSFRYDWSFNKVRS